MIITACGVKSARCFYAKSKNYVKNHSFIGIEVKTLYFYIVFMVIEVKTNIISVKIACYLLYKIWKKH